MVRQRSVCWRKSLMSAPYGEFSGIARSKLADHERDGRKRRAEFVCGGGGKTVDRGNLLLAREHEFGRGQRIGKFSCLISDAPGIGADEGDRDHDRGPNADDVSRSASLIGSPRHGSGCE